MVSQEQFEALRAEVSKAAEEVGRGSRAELQRAVEEVKRQIAEDALVWAVPFIQLAAAEFVHFLVGALPVPPLSKTCFKEKVFYEFLTIIQRELRTTIPASKALCDRIVTARKLGAHCGSAADLKFRVSQCQRLFAKYPALSSLLPDQCSLLMKVPTLLNAFRETERQSTHQ